MALMLAMVGDERQTEWDIQLPHVESAYNNSVSAVIGLAPNEVYMGRLPRLPLTAFDLSNIGGHQSLNRDRRACIDIATVRKQRAYRAVRELHVIYVSRLDRRNDPLMDALRLPSPFSVDGWAWIYNSGATIRQGARRRTDAIVLKLSYPSIGSALSRSSPWALHRPPSFQMVGPFTTSSCTSTSRPTCPDTTPNLASPLSAANHGGTPTTFPT